MAEENPGGESVLEGWVNGLATMLNVDPRLVDIPLLLDVARDAAHNVTRTAAPVATFVVGLAAAQHGGTQQAVIEAAKQVQDHASSFEAT
jgi:hypothetical protein